MVDPAPHSIRDLHDIEPWDFYESIREHGPVAWDHGANAWLVTGFAEAAYVERNEDLFAETTAALPGADRLTHPREFRLLTGEPHRILHRFLSQLWAPRAVEPYRGPVVRRIIDERIERVVATGSAELWRDLASIVPIAVVAELIGLPADHDEQLRAGKAWTEAVLRWRHSYGEDVKVTDEAADASQRLDAIALPIIRERRAHPTGDLISRLWEVGPTIFADWCEDDILANVKPLFEAGSDTSANLICSVLYAVLTDDSIRAQVAGGGEPLIRLIEETLRLRTVVHWRARRATQDVELGGVTIRAGERVHPVNAAANRDPRRYENPGELDLGRMGYYAHLAFNVGPRQCAGAAIARMEAYEATIAVLASMPDVQLDPKADPPRYLGYVVRSFRPLHVQFEPRAKVARA